MDSAAIFGGLLANSIDSDNKLNLWKRMLRLTADYPAKRARLLQLAEGSMTCPGCGFSVCRKRCRYPLPLRRRFTAWRTVIERSAHDFQFGVLIVHRGLCVAVPHRSHYGREVAGSHQNSRAIVVSRAVENQFFREARFVARFSEEIAN